MKLILKEDDMNNLKMICPECRGDGRAWCVTCKGKHRIDIHFAYQPTAWQLDPSQITAKKVLYWLGDTMIAEITLDMARNLIAERGAFIIGGNAIAGLDGYGHYIS